MSHRHHEHPHSHPRPPEHKDSSLGMIVWLLLVSAFTLFVWVGATHRRHAGPLARPQDHVVVASSCPAGFNTITQADGEVDCVEPKSEIPDPVPETPAPVREAQSPVVETPPLTEPTFEVRNGEIMVQRVQEEAKAAVENVAKDAARDVIDHVARHVERAIFPNHFRPHRKPSQPRPDEPLVGGCEQTFVPALCPPLLNPPS